MVVVEDVDEADDEGEPVVVDGAAAVDGAGPGPAPGPGCGAAVDGGDVVVAAGLGRVVVGPVRGTQMRE